MQDNYSWAKAIVICSFWYGRYHIPNELQGRIAKYYLTDGRRNTKSKGYHTSIAFEKYLTDCGLQVATDRDFGITALRWAAMQAGIGIIRKNNFFYTWKNEEEFPCLEEWGKDLTYSKIVLSDYSWLKSVLQPKLWYIPKGKEWRYKTNALSAMLNNYEPDYLPVIEKACNDEYAEVRDMAKWVLDEIFDNGAF